MKRMKTLTLYILAMAVLLCGCAFGSQKKISKDAALQAALTEAGLTKEQVVDISVEFEKDRYSAWYEVEFESGNSEYNYNIDAYTGDILSYSSGVSD